MQICYCIYSECCKFVDLEVRNVTKQKATVEQERKRVQVFSPFRSWTKVSERLSANQSAVFDFGHNGLARHDCLISGLSYTSANKEAPPCLACVPMDNLSTSVFTLLNSAFHRNSCIIRRYLNTSD